MIVCWAPWKCRGLLTGDKEQWMIPSQFKEPAIKGIVMVYSPDTWASDCLALKIKYHCLTKPVRRLISAVDNQWTVGRQSVYCRQTVKSGRMWEINQGEANNLPWTLITRQNTFQSFSAIFNSHAATIVYICPATQAVICVLIDVYRFTPSRADGYSSYRSVTHC